MSHRFVHDELHIEEFLLLTGLGQRNRFEQNDGNR